MDGENGNEQQLITPKCPHCARELQDATPLMNPVGSGALLCTFVCSHQDCSKVISFQIVPPNWVIPPDELEAYLSQMANGSPIQRAPSPNISKVLADIRNRRKH